MRINEFKRVEFVDCMPEKKEFGVLYVSKRFNLVICMCPCGCGTEAVMPINNSNGWVYFESGGKVSLSPSVATNCPNKAHFFIRENRIVWV